MQKLSAIGGEKMLKLYSYWWSSCSHRARLALNLKGLDYEYIPVNLLKGEQHSAEFRKINPVGFVPALVDGDFVVSDSFAIIMYLEEKYPDRPLLPRDPQKRAINYQAANIVCSSIQPLIGLGPLKYIEEKINADEKDAWVKKTLEKGSAALEKLLVNHAGKYATGDEVFLADLFLEPQIYGAITRFKFDIGQFPTLARLHEAYGKLPVFQEAIPHKQPDAPSSSG